MGKVVGEMILDSLFSIIQQSIVILAAIVLLYFVHNWMARSQGFEEQRRVSLSIARQVRRRELQNYTDMLQAGQLDGRYPGEGDKSEEQDGIK
jgi:uncharacterized membrane protein